MNFIYECDIIKHKQSNEVPYFVVLLYLLLCIGSNLVNSQELFLRDFIQKGNVNRPTAFPRKILDLECSMDYLLFSEE